jgi:N utilization substance protein B
MRNARRRARELATQALYQWLVSGGQPSDIDAHIRGTQGFDKADRAHFDALLYGVVREAASLDAAIAPCLDRTVAELSPVERAVLMVGTFELRHHLDIPYRVVINEGVELAKTFGGTDGYKYVNGVLDKLAAQIRPDEAQQRRAPPSKS